MSSEKIKSYLPLISLTGIAALAGVALTYSSGGGMIGWMHYFMGFFLCAFAMLKIFDLPGFAKGFRMYDIPAQKIGAYAYVYPFIELGLGLGYLGFVWPKFVYTATVIVMGIGAAGVIKGLKSGLKISCPCMGTALKVPLSTVTLTEDILMAVMAAFMLVTL